jgi:hypothetical protein
MTIHTTPSPSPALPARACVGFHCPCHRALVGIIEPTREQWLAAHGWIDALAGVNVAAIDAATLTLPVSTVWEV